eukprot:COSAG06_NODE_73740_length_152_cov_191.264151_1_plen_29_part_10
MAHLEAETVERLVVRGLVPAEPAEITYSQ